MNGADDPLTAFKREVHREGLMTDSLAGHLEYRVIALEEVLATRWPARIFAAARLGRALRKSVEHMPGETWADRRINAAGADWLSRVRPGGALDVPPGGAR